MIVCDICNKPARNFFKSADANIDLCDTHYAAVQQFVGDERNEVETRNESDLVVINGEGNQQSNIVFWIKRLFTFNRS